MKARVLVLEKFNEPLQLTQIDLPEPGEGEVLAKVTAAGICGSDLHIRQGKDPRTPLPIILGHEGVGEVAEVGTGATDADGFPLTPGDPIVWERSFICGACYFCVKNEEYLCLNRKIYGINIGSEDPPQPSGNYADYIILRKGTHIYPLGPHEDPATLVAATCSGATAAHAHERAGILPGDTVVIYGAGPVAIFSAAFAKHGGAAHIIVITNRRGPKAALIAKFGVKAVLIRSETSEDGRRKKIMDITKRIGADVVIDTTPDPANFPEAIQLLRRGGTYINPGAAVPSEKIPVEFCSDIVNKCLTIKGVWASDASHLGLALELMRYSGFPFHEMVTHKFTLEEHEKAWDALRNKDGVKIVFTP